MKAGDLITAYHKGYHTLIEFKDRGKGISPLARYKKFANSNGKRLRSNIILECDASFCELATKHIKAEIEKNKIAIADLEKLLGE